MLSYLTLIIPVLINVAFFTLLERKILGLSQARKGPNKVSFMGLLQPFADAVKLLFKQSYSPLESSAKLFFCAPALSLFLVLMIWGLVPLTSNQVQWNLSALLLLVLMGLNLYPLLLAGWSSNSKYGLLGAMRGVAQTVSYEISLALILLSLLVITCTANLLEWGYVWSKFSWMLSLPLLLLWVITSVAETNRSPFDFAEGESELVSGFNIEYGSFGFTMLFLAEYASILALSMLSALILTNQGSLTSTSMTGALTMAYMWVWLRATLPRHRYDLLMNLAWKSLLPLTLGILLFYVTL